MLLQKFPSVGGKGLGKQSKPRLASRFVVQAVEKKNGLPDLPSLLQKASSSLKLTPKQQLMLTICVSEGGLKGTTALAIAATINSSLALSGHTFATHIDPLGGFHVDPHALAVASLFAVPVLLWDSLVMLPDWKPIVEKIREEDTKRMLGAAGKWADQMTKAVDVKGLKAGDPLPALPLLPGVPAAAQATRDGAAAKPLLPLIPITADTGDLELKDVPGIMAEALKFCRDRLTASNPGRFMTPTEEAGVVAFTALGAAMQRAVVLQALSGWMSDRCYEAGLEDVLGGAVPDTAKLAALGFLVGYTLCGSALKNLALGKSIQVIPLNTAAGTLGSPPVEDMAKMLGMGKRFRARLQLGDAALSFKRFLDLSATMGAYLVTGNLFAAVAAQFITEGVLCVHQRRAAAGMEAERRERMTKVKDAMKKMRDAREALELRRVLGEVSLAARDAEELSSAAASHRDMARIEGAVRRARTLTERYSGRLDALRKALDEREAAAATARAISASGMEAMALEAAAPSSSSSSASLSSSSASVSARPAASGSVASTSSASSSPAGFPPGLSPLAPSASVGVSALMARVVMPSLTEMAKSLAHLRSVKDTAGATLARVASFESDADLLERGEALRMQADVASLESDIAAGEARLAAVKARLDAVLQRAGSKGPSGTDSLSPPEDQEGVLVLN